MVFDNVFSEWPLGIATELKARIPEASIGGLAWYRDGVLKRVESYHNPRISPLDSLDEWSGNGLQNLGTANASKNMKLCSAPA